MADHFDKAANRNYAAGKASGLRPREISREIRAGEVPVPVHPPVEDDAFYSSDAPRPGDCQGENPVD